MKKRVFACAYKNERGSPTNYYFKGVSSYVWTSNGTLFYVRTINFKNILKFTNIYFGLNYILVYTLITHISEDCFGITQLNNV